MDVKQIMTKYISRVVEIDRHQNEVENSATEEIAALRQEKLNADRYLGGVSTSFRKFIYHDAYNGFLKVLEGKEYGIDERIDSAFARKNKQFCWLLTDYYEAFTVVLTELYALSGLMNLDSWPMSDFGSVRISEAKAADYSWFLARANEKNGRPQKIIRELRKTYPNLACLEERADDRIFFPYIFAVVEELRHVIVHRGGVVKSRELFNDAVLRNMGLSSSGKLGAEVIEQMSFYFGLAGLPDTIVMLNFWDQDVPHLRHSRFSGLVGPLTSYALAVAAEMGLPDPGSRPTRRS